VNASELGEKLRTTPGGVALALRLGTKDYADNYVATLQATLRDASVGTNTHTIFVSVTNPASLVNSLAQALDVPTDEVSYIDAISHIMMNYRDPLPNASYIESPRMLEDIMLRIEFLLRRFPKPRHVVVIDSVNTLAIHNPPDLLSEFFHIMLNNLKARQVLSVLLTTTDENSPTIDQILQVVVDESIEVRANPRGS
jgi:KaiC/GvpD/RAD55 family RecA-like ATPase